MIFDFISELLKDGLNFTEKEYNEYYQNLITLTNQKRLEINTKLLNLRGLLKKVKGEADWRGLKLLELAPDHPARQINENKVIELRNEQDKLNGEIEKLESQLREPETDRLTIEQFLNLSKKAASIVKSADAYKKDQIVREIFLNLEVDETKVASYRLKELFATLLKQRQVLASRGGEN